MNTYDVISRLFTISAENRFAIVAKEHQDQGFTLASRETVCYEMENPLY
jgi:hypothetical protein